MNYLLPIFVFVILLSNSVSYASERNPLKNKALICTSKDINFKDQPIYFLFDQHRAEYIVPIVYFDYSKEKVLNKTHTSEVRLRRVYDFSIQWYASQPPLCFDYLGCNSALYLFSIDRTSLALSSAIPMQSGDRIYPTQMKDFKSHNGYFCEIASDLSNLRAQINTSINQQIDALKKQNGIPLTDDEAEIIRQNKLKDRKI